MTRMRRMVGEGAVRRLDGLERQEVRGGCWYVPGIHCYRYWS